MTKSLKLIPCCERSVSNKESINFFFTEGGVSFLQHRLAASFIIASGDVGSPCTGFSFGALTCFGSGCNCNCGFGAPSFMFVLYHFVSVRFYVLLNDRLIYLFIYGGTF